MFLDSIFLLLTLGQKFPNFFLLASSAFPPVYNRPGGLSGFTCPPARLSVVFVVYLEPVPVEIAGTEMVLS